MSNGTPEVIKLDDATHEWIDELNTLTDCEELDLSNGEVFHLTPSDTYIEPDTLPDSRPRRPDIFQISEEGRVRANIAKRAHKKVFDHFVKTGFIKPGQHVVWIMTDAQAIEHAAKIEGKQDD